MSEINIRLRLPAQLHKQLVRDAKHNLRSLNSEILWRLSGGNPTACIHCHGTGVEPNETNED